MTKHQFGSGSASRRNRPRPAPSAAQPSARAAATTTMSAMAALVSALLAAPSAVLGAETTTGSGSDLVARGEYLVNAGDCMGCHTAKGGKPFAGGLMMETPFGAISTPNITPDKTTGIGAWTDDQFYKLMHEGIGHKGEYIYPVMPFPWYSRVTHDDVMAIRAYLNSVAAVDKPRLPSTLVWPTSIRTSLLAWRQVFFEPGTFKPDPTQTAEVNRGSYLVNGLTHCGECHNGHQAFGNSSKYREALQGGVIDNWYAPNISSSARDGIGDWSNDQIKTYLKTGVTPSKGVAAGPMAETVHSLSKLTDADLLAIAAYLKTTPATDPSAGLDKKHPLFAGAGARGGDTYLNYCASCHGTDGAGLQGAIPALTGNGSVTAKGPENVINVVIGGLRAREGYGPMLAIGAGMTDVEVADVTNFVRQNWANSAPPTATAEMVGKARKKLDTFMTAGPKNGCVQAYLSPAEKAIGSSKDLQARFARISQAQMPQEAQNLVASARKAAPKAKQAEVVNGLTLGYCQVVRADTSLDWNQRALRLGHFSELAYEAATGNRVVAGAVSAKK